MLKTQFLDQIGDTDDPTVKQFASYVKNFKGKGKGKFNKPFKSSNRPGAKIKKDGTEKKIKCFDCEGIGHKRGDPRCTHPKKGRKIQQSAYAAIQPLPAEQLVQQ